MGLAPTDNDLFPSATRTNGTGGAKMKLVTRTALTVLLGLFLTLVTATWSIANPNQSPKAFEIISLSAMPQMVSGGDVLVQVNVPRGWVDKVLIELNGVDVTNAFRADGDSTSSLVGLVEGLEWGENTLALFKKKKNGRKHKHPMAELVLTNRPITGPHFSGPQQEPFICELDVWGLEGPLDEYCSASTAVEYYYMSTVTNSFEPLDDPMDPPGDLAQTTTVDGNTVDYIVRVELGTINRAVYQVAILDDPSTTGPDPWSPEPGWNQRLVYTFGGGCNAGYHQGRGTGPVLDDLFLSQGYAVASATLNVLDTNCNDALSAETVMMVKERFVELYGVPRYTMGWGGSGGAIQQYLIAQNYPGLLDGIIPSYSYPDALSTLLGVTDSRLLVNYFQNSMTLGWTDEQKTAVSGYATFNTAVVWDLAFASRINATEACDPAIPPEDIYDPVSNPDGVRCTPYDHMVTIFGVDPTTGFARRPVDNVGMQYGLAALNEGIIAVDQFLDLNEHIGGFDSDGLVVTERTVADPDAARIAYETGRIQSGPGGLAVVPIIDVRPYLDPTGDIHDRFRSFSTQERLIASNGHADNLVILIAPPSSWADASAEALARMDEWLANLVDDDSGDVLAAKPTDLVDACWTATGEKIEEPATYDGPGECNELYPSHRDPRLVAGGPLANDIVKCQLKDIDRSDYSVVLTEADLDHLREIFPDGVCDWSKPGEEQVPLQGTFLSFGP
jgi:hypothetical protein